MKEILTYVHYQTILRSLKNVAHFRNLTPQADAKRLLFHTAGSFWLKFSYFIYLRMQDFVYFFRTLSVVTFHFGIESTT